MRIIVEFEGIRLEVDENGNNKSNNTSNPLYGVEA